MESVLKELAENLENGLITALVILVLSFMWIFKKNIPTWINNIFKVKDKLNIKALEHHDVFNTCSRVEKEVSFMKFYTHGEYDISKSKMCKDFTKHKIKVCSESFNNILKDDIEKMKSDQFKMYIIEAQTQMHIKYIGAIVDEWREKGISEDDIRYVIDLFEKFRYDVVKAFEYRINSIFSTTSHKNNTRRLLAIFEMWAFGIDMLPRDMQVTFETLNGRFKEINY